MVIAALLLMGCASSTSQIELTSYKDPYFPEPYVVELEQCAYRVGPNQDLHIAGKAHDPAEGEDGPLTQFIHLHVYWTPWPGKTPADQSSANAFIRYVLVTQTGVAEYTGTGFVFPKDEPPGKIEVTVDSAYLKLELLEGQVPDVLGDTRMQAELHADDDAIAAARLIRASQILREP